MSEVELWKAIFEMICDEFDLNPKQYSISYRSMSNDIEYLYRNTPNWVSLFEAERDNPTASGLVRIMKTFEEELAPYRLCFI